MTAAPPWIPVPRLDRTTWVTLRRRAIFECCKWDPQIGDVATLAPFPLVLTRAAWRELSSLAEALARELAAFESELAMRTDLHGRLGLPRGVRAALAAARESFAPGIARLVRFDFHLTRDGWRISEANSDVPGGLNEASGLPPLLAAEYSGAEPAGDPAGAYVDAILSGSPHAGVVGFIHATAYSDDCQMMTYLARRCEGRGAAARLASPAELVWREGRAALRDGMQAARTLVRFFPADWLCALPAGCGWRHFYAGGRTPVSNPAVALLTQCKRHPLVWDDCRTPLPVWRAMLPETRDPREVQWERSGDWVVKPSLGRVGEDVLVPGIVVRDEPKLRQACRRHPEGWVAQRRFEAVPLELDGQTWYPCIGVYTVDGQAIGAYGRVATRPLIDGSARDAAVLVEAAA